MENKHSVGSASASNTGTEFTTFISSGEFDFVADEPLSVGGNNLGPAPGDYLCMALASCKAMTLRMYVRRKQWNVDSINIEVNLVKGEHAKSGTNTFHTKIQVSGILNEEQLNRMQYIAKACPISRLLVKQSEVVVTVTADEPKGD
jgi:putative redox protein